MLELILQFLPVSNPPNNVQISPSNPIYVKEPNKDFIYSRGRFFEVMAKKHSNNYGFINRQDYLTNASSPLLAIIGDSFVEAFQVNDGSTMTDRLQEKVGKNGRIYSFGFGGNQLPMYLAYAQYAQQQFHPEGMVFVIVGNDYDLSISKFDNKPNYYFFFPQEDGKMIWKFNPYRLGINDRLLRYSALYRYLKNNIDGFMIIENLRGKINNIINPDKNSEQPVNQFDANTSIDTNPERVDLSKRGVEEFLRLLPEMTGLPANRILFLVLGRNSFEELNSDMDQLTYIDIMHEYFLKKAQEEGYETIDIQTVLSEHHKKYNQPFTFTTDAHWNELGHQLAAEQIEKSHLFLELFQGH